MYISTSLALHGNKRMNLTIFEEKGYKVSTTSRKNKYTGYNSAVPSLRWSWTISLYKAVFLQTAVFGEQVESWR